MATAFISKRHSGKAVVGLAAMLVGFGFALKPTTRRWGVALLVGGPLLALMPLMTEAEAAPEIMGPGITASGEPELEARDVVTGRAVGQETTIVSITSAGEPSLLVQLGGPSGTACSAARSWK